MAPYGPPDRPGHGPAGWPAGVRPPGAPDWERSAVGWLFDLCPPDYRQHEVLRRHPVVLAWVARRHVAAGVAAARDALADVRRELAGAVPPEAVAGALAALEREGARLARTGREVALVAAALRGDRPAPRR